MQRRVDRRKPIWSILLLWLAASPAAAADARTFAHGDWRSDVVVHTDGSTVCSTSTGGDGDASFSVQGDAAGFTMRYVEPTARGVATQLREDDEVHFTFDDAARTDYDDIAVQTGIDDDGIPFAHAGLPSGYAAEFTARMRAAGQLAVSRVGDDGVRQTLHTFSLKGFTANFAKLGAWCGFDPKALFVP